MSSLSRGDIARSRRKEKNGHPWRRKPSTDPFSPQNSRPNQRKKQVTPGSPFVPMFPCYAAVPIPLFPNMQVMIRSRKSSYTPCHAVRCFESCPSSMSYHSLLPRPQKLWQNTLLSSANRARVPELCRSTFPASHTRSLDCFDW